MGRILRGNFAEQYDGTLFEHADGLPRLWWADDLKWCEREYVTSIERPVEDRALMHVWLEARALRHLNTYRTALADHEAQILALELRCLRENRHFSAMMRHEWIAERMNGANFKPRQVKAVLEEVTEILRNAEMARVLEVLEAARQRKKNYFRGVVQEVFYEVYTGRRAA